jgi:hypothetical protein
MSTNDQERSLLSSKERDVCEQVAAAGESPHNQRAQALLALDTGATQAEAGLQAGLTPGQVRYWLFKFRQERLGIFPDSPAGQVQTAKAVEKQVTAKKEKKAKKSKKAKKTKKGKKDPAKAKGEKKSKKKKKGKKSKKGKKAKK